MTKSRSLAAALLVLAVPAVPARAQGVWNATHPGPAPHATIQEAVDAAQGGDVLLVAPWVYPGFEVAGKSLWILKFPYLGPAYYDFDVFGTVTVRDLSADQEVVLAADEISGRLELRDNRGSVRVQGLYLFGNGCSESAVRISDCDAVTLSEATVFGFNCSGQPALELVRSNVVAHGSTFQGGNGAPDGGPGARVTDGFLLLSGSGAGGGDGVAGGDGGDGVETAGNAVVQVLGGWLVPGSAGGPPGAAGSASSGPGLVQQFAEGPPLVSRVWPGADLLVEGAPRQLLVRTNPVGGTAVLANGPYPGWIPVDPPRGIGLLAPGWIGRQLLGPVGSSVSQGFSAPAATLNPAEALRKVHLQGLVVDARGGTWLGSPIQSVVLNAEADPACAACSDCNGDGLNDLAQLLDGSLADCNRDFQPDACQLASGQLPDCNGNGVPDSCDVAQNPGLDQNFNGIPDTCEPPVTAYVDPTAPPGGDGSLAAPYPDLATALKSSLTGDTLVLLDGVYAGPANSDLALTKGLVIRSLNGPQAVALRPDTVLLRTPAGFQQQATLEGLTIEGASGGALLLDGGHLVLLDCTVRGTTGAVAVRARCQRFEMTGCALEGNQAGALELGTSQGVATVLDCAFRDNTGPDGAAIAASGAVAIAYSTFEGNSTPGLGGALHLTNAVAAPGAVLSVDHCLFVGNDATAAGGAISVSGLLPSLVPQAFLITSSTFADNTSTFGGALRCFGSTDVEVANCIFWNNAATFGAQIALASSTSAALIRFSDVQGGMERVYQHPGKPLAWSTGNVSVNPRFAGPGDWRLAPGSPCIDAGARALLSPDHADVDGDLDVTEPVELDLDFGPRLVEDPTVPNTGVGVPPLDLGAYEAP